MSILGTAAALGGASLIGNLLNPVTKGLGNLMSGGTWKQSGQEIASQEFNADQAVKQREWEEKMSSSAYQRSMADLEAAGLNPALIYGTGGAASTPSGSAAHSSPIANSNPLMGNFASILNSAANLMNSSTRQLSNDRYSQHLDYKERDKVQMITNHIYDAAGQLLSKAVQSKNFFS